MFSLFRTRPLEFVIDRGRVACPIRGGDADIELCAGCQWLSEFGDTANPPVIRCRPELAPVELLDARMWP